MQLFIPTTFTNVTLARLKCKLPDDGRRPKHVGAVLKYISIVYKNDIGDRGGSVVKVLYYKSEARCFDPRYCHWNFSLT